MKKEKKKVGGSVVIGLSRIASFIKKTGLNLVKDSDDTSIPKSLPYIRFSSSGIGSTTTHSLLSTEK